MLTIFTTFIIPLKLKNTAIATFNQAEAKALKQKQEKPRKILNENSEKLKLKRCSNRHK